jgi:hypothetical protein
MTERPVKTGKKPERRVADAYRAMGARKVEHDVVVEMGGHWQFTVKLMRRWVAWNSG